MDAHSAKFVVLIVERFFLSGNRILFLACVNSALWLWSSPFLFHSCAVVGVFPCFFRFASQTNPLLATKEMIICWKMPFYWLTFGLHTIWSMSIRRWSILKGKGYHNPNQRDCVWMLNNHNIKNFIDQLMSFEYGILRKLCDHHFTIKYENVALGFQWFFLALMSYDGSDNTTT